MTRIEFHPSLQTMERYLDDALPDFELAALEDHFAECGECMATLQRMESLLFSGFTAKAHATAVAAERLQSDPLARALRKARELFAGYGEALDAWLGSKEALWAAKPASEWGGIVPVHTWQDAPLEISLSEGETRAEVFVHKDGITMIVTVPGERSEIAVLFEKDNGKTVWAESFQPGSGKSTAAFPNVPRGEYRLAIAPAPAS
jgi:Putative zinc-finger